MSVLRRKGYVAKVVFNGRDKVLVGTVLGIDDLVEFHGDSIRSLTKAFAVALDDYLAACEALDRDPQRAYSGAVSLRMSPKTHSMAVMAADAQDMSLNSWIEGAVRKAALVDLGEV
jgi:predicted HicB family RNase H-like nuclease